MTVAEVKLLAELGVNGEEQEVPVGFHVIISDGNHHQVIAVCSQLTEVDF